MNFTDYAASKGLQLLRDDITFIKLRLHSVPKKLRKTYMLRYIELWMQGIADTDNAQLKQSAGRYRANIWLLNHTRGI
jgi:hypothetical protein